MMNLPLEIVSKVMLYNIHPAAECLKVDLKIFIIQITIMKMKVMRILRMVSKLIGKSIYITMVDYKGLEEYSEKHI